MSYLSMQYLPYYFAIALLPVAVTLCLWCDFNGFYPGDRRAIVGLPTVVSSVAAFDLLHAWMEDHLSRKERR